MENRFVQFVEYSQASEYVPGFVAVVGLFFGLCVGGLRLYW